MIVSVVKGGVYALSCAVPCTVAAVLDGGREVLLLDVVKGGQYAFVAPTDTVTISDNDALVTQTFKSAALGLAAQGGQYVSIEGDDDIDGTKTFRGVVAHNSPQGSGDVVVAKYRTSDGLKGVNICIEAHTGNLYFTMAGGNRRIFTVAANGLVGFWNGGDFGGTAHFFSPCQFDVGVTMSQTLVVGGDILKGNTSPAAVTGISVLNRGEADARYARFVKLTAAEYAGMQNKSDVIYITTDTNKVYFGSIALN